MGHRHCCRSQSSICGFDGGRGNNWWIWIFIIFLICGCNNGGGRRGW